jgi:hypothetical protein
MVVKTLKVYCVLSVLILGGSLYVSTVKMAMGIMIALCVFGGNLYWISKSTSIFLEACKNEQTSQSGGFLSSIRFFVFIVSILFILLVFGWVPVLIGNSLIVCTLLGTTLFSYYLDTKDPFNE